MRSQNKICEERKKDGFAGVIDTIYIDSKARKFQLKNNSRELSLWYYGNSYIAIGDSISKKPNKSEYYIYKLVYPDSVIILNFTCGN